MTVLEGFYRSHLPRASLREMLGQLRTTLETAPCSPCPARFVAGRAHPRVSYERRTSTKCPDNSVQPPLPWTAEIVDLAVTSTGRLPARWDHRFAVRWDHFRRGCCVETTPAATRTWCPESVRSPHSARRTQPPHAGRGARRRRARSGHGAGSGRRRGRRLSPARSCRS